jgi:hypothetical protein
MAKQRDKRGRFRKGWEGGPGAGAHRVTQLRAQLQAAVTRVITPAKADQFVEMLFTQAVNEHDMVAARALIPYILGRPPEPVSPAELSPQPLDLVRLAPMSLDIIAGNLQRILAQVEAGQISEAEARLSMDLLDSLVKVRQIEEVARRLETIEDLLQRGNGNHHA